MARATLEVPAKPGRRSRSAVLAVRFMAAELAKPQSGVLRHAPDSISVYLVDLREIDRPAGEAAVIVQQLVHARDGKPGLHGVLRPITDAFEPEDAPLLAAYCTKLEGRTARQKNPHPPGSLAYAAWVCARLGGWTGYYGKPGPVVMLHGWQQFQAGKAAILAMIPQRQV
jgi:hypothetical protein